MRTTIEITDEQRSKLLEAAAKCGEKGFSMTIQEALDHYFEAAADRREKSRARHQGYGHLGGACGGSAGERRSPVAPVVAMIVADTDVLIDALLDVSLHPREWPPLCAAALSPQPP
ncbi:MAG TPA: hypothetical protein VGS57_04465 [Thermoanaerobaculia bacterium]|jgi:hypothetical protein|nr:hypothetical protein [Thermoanaerobaculia bacterium]